MIRWLVQNIVDHPDLSALRPPPGLLTAAEAAHYATLRSAQRRRDWLLGRWTAKQLVQQHVHATQGYSPACDSFGISYEATGAPYIATREGQSLPLALTISHSHGYAFCALADYRTGSTRIGADIELVAPRPTTFAQEFFTPAEQSRLATAPPDQRDLLTTTLWCAKEATLKASGHGLTMDPRQVECTLHPVHPRHWLPLRVTFAPTLRATFAKYGPLKVWWRVFDNRLRPGANFVLTLAAYNAIL